MMIKILLLVCSLFAGFSADVFAENLNPKEASEMILKHKDDDKFVIVDVRTPDEFKKAHISGAILLDYYAADFKEKLSLLDRKKTYLLVCRSGNRSSKAMSIMKDLKFEQYFHIDGGMNAWTAEGLPTVN